MEEFVHQQTIAIFRRLLSTLTDSDEARRERLLKLLAAEEAKSILPPVAIRCVARIGIREPALTRT
jgi:hypothetical protein